MEQATSLANKQCLLKLEGFYVRAGTDQAWDRGLEVGRNRPGLGQRARGGQEQTRPGTEG